MTRTRKKAEDRKREIVLTAIRLAGEMGPDRLTTQHIADAVGLSQPAIFRHFASKSDIWLAVGEFIVSSLSQEDIETSNQNPADRILELVGDHFNSIARTPAIPAILFSRELHADNEPLRQHFEKVMEIRRNGFATLFTQGIKQKTFKQGLNAQDGAALVLAIIQGTAMRWSLENQAFDLRIEGTRLMEITIAGFKT